MKQQSPIFTSTLHCILAGFFSGFFFNIILIFIIMLLSDRLSAAPLEENLSDDLVGKQIILRVKDSKMRIFYNDCLVVTYDTPEGKGHLVQNKRFYEDLRKDREMNKRKYKSSRRIKGRAKYTISPSKPQYAMDVEVRPLSIYDQSVEEVRP